MWGLVLVSSLNHAHSHPHSHPHPALNIKQHSGSPSTAPGHGGRSLCSAPRPAGAEAKAASASVGAHQPSLLRGGHHLPNLHHHRYPHCILHRLQTPGPQNRRQRRPAPLLLRR